MQKFLICTNYAQSAKKNSSDVFLLLFSSPAKINYYSNLNVIGSELILLLLLPRHQISPLLLDKLSHN